MQTRLSVEEDAIAILKLSFDHVANLQTIGQALPLLSAEHEEAIADWPAFFVGRNSVGTGMLLVASND